MFMNDPSEVEMYYGERFNSISHIIGAMAALAGLVIIVVEAASNGDPWKIVSMSIYGATLFLLYTLSSLYHSLRGRAKIIFRRLDHYAIYFLIAGTYTPITLVTLHGALGWTLFGIIWGLAVIGIIIDSLPRQKHRIPQVIIYLTMGWLALFALKSLIEVLPTAGFVLLLVGGLFYTTGIIFFAFDTRVKHFHGIWHLFVLAGSLCHYLTMLLYVA
jgi:hemolysin III